MATIKKLRFDNDVLDIIQNMTFEAFNDQIVGFIDTGQLERDLYVRLDKALKSLGGKWNRSRQGHFFQSDPRSSVEGLLDNGYLEIENEGWFPTPEAVVVQMIDFASIGIGTGMILEPSAGEGHIVDVLMQYGISKDRIDCVEKNTSRAETLRNKGYRVYCDDFLAMKYNRLELRHYDRIFMNPPFEAAWQDIEHVQCAYQYLAPGGRLISIMSPGSFFRTDQKAVNFRAWFNDLQGKKENLPEGSFKSSGTIIKTVMVLLCKPEVAYKDKSDSTNGIMQLKLF